MTISRLPQFFSTFNMTSERQREGQGGSSQTGPAPSHLSPLSSDSSHPSMTASPASSQRIAGYHPLIGMSSKKNSSASSSQAPKPEDVDNFTENIYAELTKAGQTKYCHYDSEAFVLLSCPGSEEQQKKLIRATIASADKFAIMTSYLVRPRMDDDPNKISAAMFTILEFLSKKQNDKEFSFVFLYNENHLQNNPVIMSFLNMEGPAKMSLDSATYKKGATTWPEVIEAYNRQQSNDDLKIQSLDCNVYFIAAKARGLAGSHHNKFCINDRGIAATLGASIANKTKDNWYDSGCITLSQTLASKQRDYFVDELVGNHDGRYRQLKMQDGKPIMEKLEDASKIKGLKDIPVKNPMNESSDGEAPSGLEALKQILADCGLSPKGAKRKVLWIQNPSHSYKNALCSGGGIDGKPIGYALCRLFDSAEPGDTINIFNKTIGSEGFDLIAKALAKGCNVNILINAGGKKSLEIKAEKFFSQKKSNETGKLTIKPFSPNEKFSEDQKLNNKKEPVGHGKTYILVKQNGARVIMTGTYNLDGQSHYRSNENVMVTTTYDDELSKILFDDIYEGSSGDITSYPRMVLLTPRRPYLPMFPC